MRKSLRRLGDQLNASLEEGEKVVVQETRRICELMKNKGMFSFLCEIYKGK